MRYLHTMVRVTDVDQSLDFYCNKLGMKEVRRVDSEAGRFTLIFLAADEDENPGREKRAPLVELTYNWDTDQYDMGNGFGHLAIEVDDVYRAAEAIHRATLARWDAICGAKSRKRRDSLSRADQERDRRLLRVQAGR